MIRVIALGAIAVWALFPTFRESVAATQDFTLTNGSGSQICYLYLAPSKSEDWAEDVLGPDCLAPGESVKVMVRSAGSVSRWDLRVEDEDENYEDYRGFNLNRISTITIKGGGKAEYE